MKKGLKSGDTIKLLLQSLLFVLIAATYSLGSKNGPMFPEYFGEQKYDSEEFSLYPSQFVVHTDGGDLSYKVLLKEDEDALGNLITASRVAFYSTENCTM